FAPAPWGDLDTVRDRATNLPLLRLPSGFSYVSYGWTGDPLPGDVPTPNSHDGMGVVRVADGRAVLVRNHEIRNRGPAFASAPVYDPRARGGTTTLVFDLGAGRWESARASLAGTSANCAGGVTPWGTWLTCEETMLHARAPHGFVFEVPADGDAIPEPLTALGCFSHEAIAVDPTTGVLYETEDHERAGFYRFIPNTPGQLRRGGRLQMLRVVDRHGVRLVRHLAVGTVLPVDWVDIGDPELVHGTATPDGNGVLWQGRLLGAATFRRLEGCWWGDDGVYFISTDGGEASAGQIWHYHPSRAQLRLALEAGGGSGLDLPDGATSLPSGAWLVHEDARRSAARLIVVAADGRIWPFAESAVVLAGERNGIVGDHRDAPWSGLTFAGDWLFVNLERPGITVAITGPWARLRA
ncbi:MAG TPA: alkaline phosphatase PhoX, partial [Candidatus Binatia bacterium]|nr:alkaline phosphatase PhoX [Candidatus Binatia bacterium]